MESITIDGLTIEDLRPIDDEPDLHIGCANHGPTVLKGTCHIGGAFCHIFFVAVVDDDENDGEQIPICDPHDRYEDLHALDEGIGGFVTCEILGWPGEWVVYLHPGER